MNYYISDCHFGYSKIIEECNRPFRNVEEMNEYMIEAWNSTVKKTDDIYIVGNIAFGRNTIEDYVTRLNGKKHLILGNQDSGNLERVAKESIDKCFVEIMQYKEIKDKDRVVVLFHYPIMEWNKKYYNSYHIHGHLHNIDSDIQKYSKENKNMFNVGADIIDFKPKTLDQLIYKKMIEDIGRMYKREMKKLYLIELISLIAKTSVEASYKKNILFDDNEVKVDIKKSIKEFIRSIPKNFDIENIVSNFNNNYNEVSIRELSIDIPRGYSVYGTNNENGDYIIKNGLTEEAAHNYYNKQLNDKYFTELILIDGVEPRQP